MAASPPWTAVFSPTTPKELGGDGANPEKLFAAGYKA
jgi:organic hydroperoxide reductase OsmC/OhrA